MIGVARPPLPAKTQPVHSGAVVVILTRGIGRHWRFKREAMRRGKGLLKALKARYDRVDTGFGFLACECARSDGLVSGCAGSGARFFTGSVVPT